MEYRTLCNSCVKGSMVGFGQNRIGIRIEHIDTAKTFELIP